MSVFLANSPIAIITIVIPVGTFPLIIDILAGTCVCTDDTQPTTLLRAQILTLIIVFGADGIRFLILLRTEIQFSFCLLVYCVYI